MRKEDVDSEEDDNVHPIDRVSVDTGKGIQKASADELASRRYQHAAHYLQSLTCDQDLCEYAEEASLLRYEVFFFSPLQSE